MNKLSKILREEGLSKTSSSSTNRALLDVSRLVPGKKVHVVPGMPFDKPLRVKGYPYEAQMAILGSGEATPDSFWKLVDSLKALGYKLGGINDRLLNALFLRGEAAIMVSYEKGYPSVVVFGPYS
jgi:hypothetical protein